MNVLLIANGAPDDPRRLDWPTEWRIPAVGELLKLEQISSTVLEVASVHWVRREMTQETVYAGTVTNVIWEVQIWVWGPAFRA